MQSTLKRREMCIIIKSVKLKGRHHLEDKGADGILTSK
jgi:hypothetical protein